MQVIHIYAAGREQDLGKLHQELLGMERNGTWHRCTIVRGGYRLTAHGQFGCLSMFERIPQLSKEMPGLRLAMAWHFSRHNVGYCIYAVGIEEHAGVDQIRGLRHGSKLWKHANAVAQAHVR